MSGAEQQLFARVEKVLGRIDFDPCSSEAKNRLVQAKDFTDPQQGIYSAWPPNVSAWVDPPRESLSGIPKDATFWTRLMKHRAEGLLKHAIYLKRGGLVAPTVEQPPQFLSCFCTHKVHRYNIPSYRAEFQLVYVPGLIDNSTGFVKAFQDFGDLLTPIKELVLT